MPIVLAEFRVDWLPHVTDDGLSRVVELIEKCSPLLIHGKFTSAVPQGCLATHIAWNHPQTRHLDLEAGIAWLSRIAGLNPATSQVIQSWDRSGTGDWALCQMLLSECRAEQRRRAEVEIEAAQLAFAS